MAKTQTLSFPIRLPDAMQEGALRLLDASRTAINGILQALWHELDAFASERSGPAWKQVERHLLTRSGHGSRQERCEMEQAGRILRAQATRKQVFLTILPLLSEGLIRPADGKRPARKDYRAISEQVRALRAGLDDPDAFMALTNVLEQACNVYLQPPMRVGSGPGGSGASRLRCQKRSARIWRRGRPRKLPPYGKSRVLTGVGSRCWI